MRIGHGYDVHAFGEGDHIIIGGVKIPFRYGLLAHSDGDVLIHSLCDALLGAAAMGDIGKHFPETDPRFLDINSRKLLRLVVSLINSKGYSVVNVDITIIAQAPKLAPYIDAMIENLSSDLESDVDVVNIKATTTENLGFEGRGEGIACHVVALIQ
ncbi:2-C-methyl-D-erythritol 2,4-cyclodiphosphate synthase [Porticoccus sp.]|mgnify:FL=1|jgi:2-C-methyl-D-erythritol 2,4-cyclodiphosphate synthase|nr:2-C-methyl-D-erythritol 2,4-cyclodiphosphate synthase [Cellvibrionales bacterium]MCH9798193.1 2-C-methyl-D-erythritol 2,4-cyclodiphosphate synthase [Gammaproteobacteria bacterium]MDA7737801.1 2-C-methyl-D-erythritol 2,4-cyclodiphosphate synthase [Porticoccus sp.]MBT7437505.1 2-C-methyl-D-erythritol 2,4-cyclodiphosphate synthase [Cellvibrionales bacterium]MDA7842268.1 2-C-methyl-D-erythritol 2,4-cyclodiphosphate synthase [Porticoccus sp.]